MQGSEIQSGARPHGSSSFCRRDHRLESNWQFHDGCLWHIKAEIISQLRGHQFRELHLRVHLTAPQFHDDLKIFSRRILASEKQRAISPRGHWSQKLGGRELKHFHVGIDRVSILSKVIRQKVRDARNHLLDICLGKLVELAVSGLVADVRPATQLLGF